jgi:hypothetical protein
MSNRVTATITTRWGQQITGQIRAWPGPRRVDVETSDAHRHIGVIPSTRASARDRARPNPNTCVNVANARDIS